jgi:hypothetical protein
MYVYTKGISLYIFAIKVEGGGVKPVIIIFEKTGRELLHMLYKSDFYICTTFKMNK